MTEPHKPKDSTWLYIGIGCGVLLLLGLLVGGIAAYWISQKVEELQDPEARAEKVRTVLGAETMPEGYHPLLSIKVPFVMELAMISDAEMDAEGSPVGDPERLFIYMKFLHDPGKDGDKLRDFFDGTSDDPAGLEQSNVNVEIEEIVGRGTLPLEDMTVQYVSTRGEVRSDSGRTGGLTTFVLMDCPDDDKMRFGIWIAPDPSAAEGEVEADLAGTPADEQEIERFVGSFHVCAV